MGRWSRRNTWSLLPAGAMWVLFCAVVPVGPARGGQEASLTASGEVDGAVRQYAGTEDEAGYHEVVQRVFLTGTGGPWTLGLEAKGVGVGPWSEDQEPPVELLSPGMSGLFGDASALVLEKVMVRYRVRGLDLALGDFGASLGRGMALNLVPNPDLDINATLMGLRVRADRGPIRAEAAAGLAHPQIISLRYPNEWLLPPPRDLVQVLRVGVTPVPGLSLDAWTSRFSFEDHWEPPAPVQERTLSPDARVFGGAFEWRDLLGAADVYLEANQLRYLSEEWFPDIDSTGYTVYGSVTTYLGAWTGLLEAKRYLNAEAINVRGGQYGYEYVTPPTLELAEAVTRDSAETIDSPNIVGYHLRLDRFLAASDSVWTLSWSHFYDLDPKPPTPSKETIGHLYTGWEWNPAGGGRIAAIAGYRMDVRSVRSHGEDRTFHASLSLESPPWGKMAVSLHALARRFQQTDEDDPLAYSDADVSAAVIYDGRYTAGLRWQYTDDPVLLNNPSLGGGEGNLLFLSRYHFGSMWLEWRPVQGAGLVLFAGARRAGLECGGGQCRFVPSFRGVELSGWFQF